MKGVPGRLDSCWTGIIALAWIAVISSACLLVYGNLPLPRWVSLGPFLKEAALLILTLGGAYGWGRLVLVRWHSQSDERSNPYFAFGLGFGVLWLATLVVAALKLLHPAWPWLLLGGGWLAFAATARRRPELRLPDVSAWTTAQWFLLFVMASSLAYSVLAWALVPPLVWDEVSYHLPMAQIFIDAGGLVNIPTMVHSNWPAGLEMLNVLALLMGSERLPHLVVTAMTVLTALALARFARRQFNGATAWLAAALYLSMPLVQALAGVALVEGALGFYGFVAIWAGYVWLESRAWQDLVMAGLLGGLTASIKLTGAAVPIAVALVGLVWLLLRYRSDIRRTLLQMMVYAVVSLAIVAPWYIRSYVNTGNPVWPFLYSIFGGKDWDSVGDQIHTAWLRRPNLPPTVKNYLIAPLYLALGLEQFGGPKLGAAIAALAPLSVFFWRRSRWLLGYLIGICAVVYTIWFITTQQTRFLMGIAAVLVLLAAYAFSQLLQQWPAWLAGPARVAMVVYLVLGLPFLDTHHRREMHDGWAYVSGNWSRDALLDSRVDGYSAFLFANEVLPGDARVLTAPWETRGYYLERPVIWANPIGQRVIKWDQLQNAEEALLVLRSLDITHVLWSSASWIDGAPKEDHTYRLLKTLLAEYGKAIYSRGGYSLYELQTQN